MITDEVLIYLIFFLGALVHGSLGFGFPMVTTPLLSFFFGVRFAILISIIPTLLNNAYSIVYGGRFIYLLKEYRVLAISGIIGSVLGTVIIIYLPAEPFKLLLAISILLYVYTQAKEIQLTFIKKNPWSMFVFGTIGGIVGGSVNVSLAIFIIYLVNVNLSKNEIIKVINFCFILGKISQFFTFVASDLYTTEIFVYSGMGLLATIPGIAIGTLVRKKINYLLFKKILNVILLGLALLIGYQGVAYFF